MKIPISTNPLKVRVSDMERPMRGFGNQYFRSFNGSNVFNRLETSPLRRQGYLIDKPPTRILSPSKILNQPSPRRLLTPTKNDQNDSIIDSRILSSDSHQKTGISNIVIPKSPSYADSEGFRTTTVLGGDGSQSRIRNRLSPMKERISTFSTPENILEPSRQNLFMKLWEDEKLSTITRKNTLSNTESNKRHGVQKMKPLTRVKRVKFELPEDRMISVEVQILKQQIKALLKKQCELESRVVELEKKT